MKLFEIYSRSMRLQELTISMVCELINNFDRRVDGGMVYFYTRDSHWYAYCLSRSELLDICSLLEDEPGLMEAYGLEYVEIRKILGVMNGRGDYAND